MKCGSDILVRYACEACGEEHYFEADSLPGGKEHCEFCEVAVAS